MGKGFSTGNSGTVEPSTQHHKQTISGEETHTLTTSIISVMASDIVDGYKLIYYPLIDYIRIHVHLCAVMLYSKASMQFLLVNSWVVYCGMQAIICMYMHL